MMISDCPPLWSNKKFVSNPSKISEILWSVIMWYELFTFFFDFLWNMNQLSSPYERMSSERVPIWIGHVICLQPMIFTILMYRGPTSNWFIIVCTYEFHSVRAFSDNLHIRPLYVTKYLHIHPLYRLYFIALELNSSIRRLKVWFVLVDKRIRFLHGFLARWLRAPCRLFVPDNKEFKIRKEKYFSGRAYPVFSDRFNLQF